jgi:alkylation response protein AidB-like acyl-CoA dehydrogenase
MQFGLTETQQNVKNTTRKFLSAECPMADVRRLMETDTAYDAALWKKMAGQGWTGIIFPEEYEGFGMGMVEMAAALEEMGRALLPGPFLSTVLLAGAAVDNAADHEAKRRWLIPICTGEARSTLALLEDSASWSVDAVQLEARSGNTLRGRKLFVPDAGVADFLVVAARMEGELALFAVPREAKGIAITPMPSVDNTRKLYEVDFDNVVAEHLLARGKRAAEAIEHALDVATVGICAEMLGGMQRLLEIAVEYAKTRKQFGKPIGSFQAVQHMCADMLVYSESSRSAAYYAAYALNDGIPDARTAISVAKAYCSDAFRECGNRAIQIHGGMGFTWENDCHLYYRRAKASEIAFGDATYHRERIARLVIDKVAVPKEAEIATALA